MFSDDCCLFELMAGQILLPYFIFGTAIKSDQPLIAIVVT